MSAARVAVTSLCNDQCGPLIFGYRELLLFFPFSVKIPCLTDIACILFIAFEAVCSKCTWALSITYILRARGFSISKHNLLSA